MVATAPITIERDVIIIGAGISGIGMACHMRKKLPAHSFEILERRDAIGGTWDLFRYPGIRSDSDMYTFGYTFKPWTEGEDIASAASIRKYLKETADEYDLKEKIHFGHSVETINWSISDKRWHIQGHTGKYPFHYVCKFLVTATGYYNSDQGYLPEFEGFDDFNGQVVHPQQWPENLDYKDKSVLVIGSGATAVTLVPAMAAEAKHVTMLQRSPTYIFTRPAKDKISNILRKILPLKI